MRGTFPGGCAWITSGTATKTRAAISCATIRPHIRRPHARGRLAEARGTELVHALDRWRSVEAGAQPLVAQAAPDAVDDLARRPVRRARSVGLPTLRVQTAEGGVGLPELGRIADPSRQGQGLL